MIFNVFSISMCKTRNTNEKHFCGLFVSLHNTTYLYCNWFKYETKIFFITLQIGIRYALHDSNNNIIETPIEILITHWTHLYNLIRERGKKHEIKFDLFYQMLYYLWLAFFFILSVLKLSFAIGQTWCMSSDMKITDFFWNT